MLVVLFFLLIKAQKYIHELIKNALSKLEVSLKTHFLL
jgi:hypothetical protein